MGTHWTNRRSPGALAQGQILVAVLHLFGLHLWSNPTNKTTNISAEKIHKRQRFEIPWKASQLTAHWNNLSKLLKPTSSHRKLPKKFHVSSSASSAALGNDAINDPFASTDTLQVLFILLFIRTQLAAGNPATTLPATSHGQRPVSW